jgi:adenosylmethionine-8-amino-7-oxononanoate aminotransferase
VLIAPPYTIDASHVDAIVGGLAAALDTAVGAALGTARSVA